MGINPYRFLVLSIIVAFEIISLSRTTDACSCMPEHAQTSYCKADFVIVARVLRRSNRKYQNSHIYKIDIRKEYKMSPKAQHYLKQGRIVTPPNDGMCGLSLEIGQLYVFAGNDYRMTICNYVKKYSDLSIVEKRGIAGGFRKGCACEIKPCFNNKCSQSIGSCNWTPWNDCESDYGVCIPSRGTLTNDGRPTKCHWRRSPPFNTCLMP